jgi:phosphoesterase RecJ-like protein
MATTEMDPTMQQLRELLLREKSFVLTTHEDPDGDGLGAEAALAEALMQLGKVVQVINSDPPPASLEFLTGSERFDVYRPADHDDVIAGAGVVILLDAARPERTGRLHDVLSAFKGTTVAIDHHPGAGWAQLDLVDPSRSATVELVYDVITALKVHLTRDMAECLYAGLVVDTQAFSGSNTTANAHALATILLRAGARIDFIHEHLLRSSSMGRLRLLGKFLTGLEENANGLLIWGKIGQDDMRAHGVTAADIEGFVDYGLTLRDAKVAILFLEEPHEVVRVSLRSKGGAEVASLARRFGGGGHAAAAGFRTGGRLQDVIPVVVAEATRILARRAHELGPDRDRS